MDFSNLVNYASPQFLDQVAELAPAPATLGSLQNISIEQILLWCGGLMGLRILLPIIFPMIGMLGFVGGTISSVLCFGITTVVGLAGSLSKSAIAMVGQISHGVVARPPACRRNCRGPFCRILISTVGTDPARRLPAHLESQRQDV